MVQKVSWELHGVVRRTPCVSTGINANVSNSEDTCVRAGIIMKIFEVILFNRGIHPQIEVHSDSQSHRNKSGGELFHVVVVVVKVAHLLPGYQEV